jgi:uncharacterized protein (TIGR01777 family)
MRVAITGASGLIGATLAGSLRRDGHEVTRLVRHPPERPDEVRWDPTASDGGINPAAFDGVDAVVHLSGAPIAGGRWTPARKQVLRDSRIQSTRALVTALGKAAKLPPVLLCGSAVGWYGDTGSREVDESAPAGTGFLTDLVRDWEAASRTGPAGLRVVNLRSGVVLSRRGGMLGPLAPLFRFGLGARLGSGHQFISWIALTDHVAAVRYLIEQDAIEGPVNLTAPTPVTNAQFTAELGRALRRPALLRVPAPVLRLSLGELSGELLGSQRVVPKRLQDAGFSFRYPGIAAALAAELAAQN